jgi:hypothetical protein
LADVLISEETFAFFQLSSLRGRSLKWKVSKTARKKLKKLDRFKGTKNVLPQGTA